MDDEQKAVASQIAQELNEPNVPLMNQVVRVYGIETAKALLAQTLEAEQEGGLMTRAGDRRRTPGGVFFWLARQQATTPEQKKVFKQWFSRWKGSEGAPPPVDTGPKLPLFVWETRQEVYESLATEKGTILAVKISVIGRPYHWEKRADVVIARFQQRHKLPLGLPKGVPQPPAEPTEYVVFIAAKQWRELEGPLTTNPETGIVAEGVVSFDPELPGIAVFATKATLKQPKKRDADGQAGQSGAPTSSGFGARAPGTNARPGVPQARPAPRTAPSSPPPAPPPATPEELREARQRLAELRTAEDESRAALDEIKALPASEQVGLSQALQALQQAKRAREQLEQRFPELKRL